MSRISSTIKNIDAGTLPPGFKSRWAIGTSGIAGEIYSYEGNFWILQLDMVDVKAIEPTLDVPETWVLYGKDSRINGGANDRVFIELDQSVTASYTIPENRNVLSMGFTVMDEAEVIVSNNTELLIIGGM